MFHCYKADVNLKSITKAAIRRAEYADPNLQRCLIENCSRTQAVQAAHVFDRKSSATSRILDGLEWGWGMRRGSLNLDTRRNICFLGASLHELYKKKKWLLLPEEDVVFQYFDDQRLRPLKRPLFPQLKGDTFKYRFFPLSDMEDIYVTRQCSDDASKPLDVHHYPFDDFPVITSHVHPTYVILHLGETLDKLEDSVQDCLLEKYPWFDRVQELCRRWRAILPVNFSGDSTFVGAPPTCGQIPSSTHSVSSGDSLCTPLRRIQPILEQPLHRASDSTSSEMDSISQHSGDISQSWIAIQGPRRKRRIPDHIDHSPQNKKKRLLTSKTLRMQKDSDGSGFDRVKWKSDRISSWAAGCSPFACPSSPPIHFSNGKSPVRGLQD